MAYWQKGPMAKNGKNWPNIDKKYQKWQKKVQKLFKCLKLISSGKLSYIMI